jgi:hypothetical protein
MPGLSAFQDAFAEALGGRAAGLAPWLDEPEGQPGLTVYRNTVAKGCADALAANFPAVRRLVGAEWFAAAALAYADEAPPARASLLGYGAGFPAWLEAFEPARGLPYLAAAARLDRLWTEAHLAADAEPLAAEALAGLDGPALARTGVVAHPSARLAWCDDNLPSLWLANRGEDELPDGFELGGPGEGVLVTRPGMAVEIRILGAAPHAFLLAALTGESLAAAAGAALQADPSADFPAIVALCLEAGAFAGLARLPETAA